MNRTEDYRCLICEVGHLISQDWFHSLLRVTSDCKPFPAGGDLTICQECYAIQKIPNSNFLSEIKVIYENYQAYEIDDGNEQIVFDINTNSLLKRSELIVRELKDAAIFPNIGKILDIGCGHGVTLKAFSNHFANWDLYGFEQTSIALGALKNLPKFKTLYTGNLGEISEKFQLITLIHTLEHLLSPFEFLKSVNNLVEYGGALFIEVCDVHENPFDLLVADHLLHFSPETLKLLLRRSGFKIIWIKTDLVKKELSVLAIKEGSNIARWDDHSYETDHFSLLLQHKNLIIDIVERSIDVSQNCESIGIFGTSIAGSWLAGILGDKTQFFVDEDPGRVGKTYMNKPVISPADIPLSSCVILAVAPIIAKLVEAKISRAGISLIKPLNT